MSGDSLQHRDAKPPSFKMVGLLLVIGIVVGAVIAGIMYLHHQHALKAEGNHREEEISKGPKIMVSTVHKSKPDRQLTLPADVRSYLQTTLYAKVSGYIKSIAVDKGDSVHKGDIIATLETPELDQQVAGAAADATIKRRTFERYGQLVDKDFVSAEDFDTAKSQLGVSTATLKQNQALQDYKVIRAPFDGTITGRYVDPGALIPAGTGSTQGALPLVDMAQLNLLRITVFVQQDAAPFVEEGDRVTLTADEQPQLKIEAKISRISRALDPRSRSMLCEVWLKNNYGLYPGTFMHATLYLHTSTLPMIPTGSVMVRDGKTLVATVQDDKLKLVHVDLGFDDGKEVQVLRGLEEGQKVGVDVPSEIVDGAKVRPIEKKNDEKKANLGNEAGTPNQPDAQMRKEDELVRRTNGAKKSGGKKDDPQKEPRQ